MLKASLIYNPNAGRFPSGFLAERAAGVLRDYGWQVTLHQAHTREHITQLARQAADNGLDACLVAGGDGSLNMAAAGLIGTQTALGVLPAGTANVWAQELGLPYLTWIRWLALEECAHLLAHSEIRSVDVGLCNGKPFLLWAGVGLDAYIVHRIEPRERWDKHLAVLQYAASAAWNAGFWRGINLRVEVQGEKLAGRYLLAVVSNVHRYAGGLAELSPEACLDDGVMDLWLFEGDTLADTLQQALDLLSGRHLKSEHVSRHLFSTLSMESDSQLYFQLDGEPVQEGGRVTIEVQPLALRVMIPRQTPQPLLSSPEST